jgi:hypothetical protein
MQRCLTFVRKKGENMRVTRDLTIALLLTAAAFAPVVSAPQASHQASSSISKSAPVPPAVDGATVLQKLSAPDPASQGPVDYLPCEFTEKQLLELRPRPEHAGLDTTDVEQIKQIIIQAAIAEKARGTFPGADVFVDLVANASLENLTYSEALNKMLSALVASSPVTGKSGDDYIKATNLESLENVHKSVSSNDNSDILSSLSMSYVSPVASITNFQKALAAQTSENTTPPETFQNAIDNLTMAIDALGKLQNKSDDSVKQQQANSLARRSILANAKTTEAWSIYRKSTKKPLPFSPQNQEDLNQAKTELSAELEKTNEQVKTSKTLNVALAAANQESLNNTGIEAVADAVRNGISLLERPKDVGCAMSLLTWNGMRYKFGQKVADEYLGVQITVRNLNPDKEFLLHDAELSVDTDLSSANPRHGRYFSGIDKQNVRAYMLAARDYDRRTLIVHIVEGIGTVLSSVSPIYGGATSDAAHVLTGAFEPALSTVWTDHHTDQLNLLNDVGFSASRNDRTFVPKSGSTQFVIFIPVQPLEQAWWTQPCVQAVSLGYPADSPVDTSNDLRTGLDVDGFRHICAAELGENRPPTTAASHSSHAPAQTLKCASSGPNSNGKCEDLDSGQSNAIRYFNPVRVPYKKWSPTTNALLKEVALAVVAGTHVIQDQDTQPSLTQVTCPKTGAGDLDFDAAKDGSLACQVTGSNLDKVNQLRLRVASQAKTAEAALTSSDGKSGSAAFKISDLCQLDQQAYKVYIVAKSGTESGGSVTVNLSQEPYLTAAPSPAQFQLDNSQTTPVTLAGCHLDKLTGVTLKTDLGKIISPTGPSSPTPISAVVTIPAHSAKNAAITGDYTSAPLAFTLYLSSKTSPTPAQTKKQINGTGKVK